MARFMAGRRLIRLRFSFGETGLQPQANLFFKLLKPNTTKKEADKQDGSPPQTVVLLN